MGNKSVEHLEYNLDEPNTGEKSRHVDKRWLMSRGGIKCFRVLQRPLFSNPKWQNVMHTDAREENSLQGVIKTFHK